MNLVVLIDQGDVVEAQTIVADDEETARMRFSAETVIAVVPDDEPLDLGCGCGG